MTRASAAVLHGGRDAVVTSAPFQPKGPGAMNSKASWMTAACLAAAACNPQGAAIEPGEPAGTLRLALTGMDDAAQVYRLRNAVFEVSGYSYIDSQYYVREVSSEDDVDAELISERFLPGSYTVSLRNEDWYLERLTAGGVVERVEQAVLLSARSQFAGIADNQTTQVHFQFGVDGTLIIFHGGDLEIGISVVRAQAGSGGAVGPDAGVEPGEPAAP